LSGEKFSSLLGPPSNEENAIEFQIGGLAFSSWNRHCELRMIAFMVTANFCAGKYEYAGARKLVFGSLCVWLRNSQANCEAISFVTSVNNSTTFPYVIIHCVVWRWWNAEYET
jgi:hypothetical protein